MMSAMTDAATRRRQVLSLILSGIFPGLGQLYNREYPKAVFFIVVGAILTWLVGRVTPTDLVAITQPSPALLPLAALLLAFWLWAIVDAWKVAGRR